MEYTPELLRCPLFQGMNYEEIEQLLSYLTVTWNNYHRHEFVVHAGDTLPGILIIIKGKLATIHVGNPNTEGTVSLLECGDVFGTAYVITKTPLLLSARTLTASQILFLHLEDDWMNGTGAPPCFSQFTKNLIPVMGQKIINLAQKMDYLHLGSVRAKLATYCLNQSKITGNSTFTLPINRSRMAEYLGISRPSMVRELGQMEKDGLIQIDGKSIAILDQDALEHIACGL